MDESKQRESVIFWVTFSVATLSFMVFIALIGAEAFARWRINQDFTFLGGYALESLGVLSLGLFLGLLRRKS